MTPALATLTAAELGQLDADGLASLLADPAAAVDAADVIARLRAGEADDIDFSGLLRPSLLDRNGRLKPSVLQGALAPAAPAG